MVTRLILHIAIGLQKGFNVLHRKLSFSRICQYWVQETLSFFLWQQTENVNVFLLDSNPISFLTLCNLPYAFTERY